MFICDPVKVEVVPQRQQKVALLLACLLHYSLGGHKLEGGGVRGVGHPAPVTKQDHVDVFVWKKLIHVECSLTSV